MFQPKSKQYENRVRSSFAKQKASRTVGLSIESIQAGEVRLSLPFNDEFTQQHGFMHAGIIATALDTACGYAAFTLMPDDAAVLSVEFKTNLMRPAKAETFQIVGKVIKPGKTVTFCEASAFAIQQTGDLLLVATMSATMMAVYNPHIKD